MLLHISRVYTLSSLCKQTCYVNLKKLLHHLVKWQKKSCCRFEIVNWGSVLLCVFCSVLSLCAYVFLAVMITIRLRNCWMAAGQCSGSRWPPAGSVSSSTCGPSSLLWSARNALKPRTHITMLVRLLWFLQRGWAEALMLSQGTTKTPLLYPETQPYTTLSIWNGGLSVAFCFIC